MFKPTTAARIAAPLRASTRQYAQPARRQLVRPSRTFATETAAPKSTPPPPPPPPPPSSGGSGSNQTLLIVGLFALLGAGGYYFLKPAVEVAQVANSAIKTAQDSTSGLTDTASSLAKSVLPPGAFSLYSAIASQPGGVNGFLSSLKDKDLQGVLDEVKKVGGDDVKRITEKVEKRVKEAKGKYQDIDWKSLAQELKQELPKDKQQLVDVMIGKMPDKEDFEKLIAKAKEVGGEQLKAAEKAAGKVLEQVEKARKEGKGQANAFLAGLKQAAPEDVDDLVKQIKEAAKKAGLPADTMESWLKSKAEDKKIDAEALGKQVEDKLRSAAKFLPNDPQDLVKQVEQVSPSIAKLLQQALEEAEVLKKK